MSASPSANASSLSTPSTPIPSAHRLSQSPLWQQQSAFYERLGQQAWRGGFVPEYITSNPFIANAYAEMVLAYWRDGFAAGTFDPTKPCYILELGAGSGRFAYLFLKRLTGLLEDPQTLQTGSRLDSQPDPRPEFVYIMTDLAQSNLAAWQENSRLADFVAAGQLDFAHFDVTQDTELTLLTRGVTLASHTLDKPLDTRGDTTGVANASIANAGIVNPGIIIANYVFDSIPNDLYYVEDGALFERYIALHNEPARGGNGASQSRLDPRADNGATQPPPTQTGRPQTSESVTITHTHHPLDLAHLQDATQVDILRAHMEHLDKTVFPLPVAALDACRRLRRLMPQGLLLLVGDKGYTTWAGLQGVGNPQKAVPGMAFHSGCYSVMVNFPALAHAVEHAGGAALLPDREPYRLGVAAFLLASQAATLPQPAIDAWPATRRAFAAQIDAFGPDDFYVLVQTLEDQLATMDLHRALALLRLSRWDPQLLAGCLPALVVWSRQVSPTEWNELRQAIERTLAHDYPSTTRFDLAYGLGLFFFQRAEYADALKCYTLSLAHQRPNTQMLYEMAICQVELEQHAAAAETLAQVLERSPNHQAARDLHAYLRRKQR